ncbi:general substrate transporter [Aspergillus undulatus]|uniref:general substrate transporter n=1 Tax=Aspergillus undulatus TaxID=1810928 RepID=UPI003CCDEE90
MENNMPTTTLWQNRKCLFLCSLVSMANLQYGFDLAAIGALQAMAGFLKVFGYPDPNAEGEYAIDGTALSSRLSWQVSSHRRQALWLACIVNAIACGIQIGAPTAGVLYVGRLLLGFANGFLVTFSNIYTAEASPSHMHGAVVALFAYWVNIGSIMGAAVDNQTKEYLNELSYRIPLACLYIVPTFLFIALFFVPESPRWLLHRGDIEGARKALEQLRGKTYAALRGSSTTSSRETGSLASTLLELEWAEMVKGVEEEKRQKGSVAALDMFRGVDLRRTLLCYGMIACQTASGVWFIIGYPTYFFTVTGVNKPFEYTIMSTCLGFIGVNFGMYAMRHLVGRRAILIVGATTCGLCQLGSAIAASASPNSLATGQVLVALTALFKFFYNGCVGAASYPVATELVSSRLRAWTGARYGYIWAGSNAVCIVFFYFFIPEMKGRSLEELDEIFAAKIPARKLRGYQCLIGEAARADAVHAEGLKRDWEK